MQAHNLFGLKNRDETVGKDERKPFAAGELGFISANPNTASETGKVGPRVLFIFVYFFPFRKNINPYSLIFFIYIQIDLLRQAVGWG